MDEPDHLLFISLFKEAYQKCFIQEIGMPLTETESKLFSNRLLDRTGLTVGWRSLKNFSFYVLDVKNEKKENPSIATLDTLSRYVLSAPYTNEISRKNEEGHHPYWFLYRERQLKQIYPGKQPANPGRTKYGSYKYPVLVSGLFILLAAGYLWKSSSIPGAFKENFNTTDDYALASRGWMVWNKEPAAWAKRQQQPGLLTLYTLNGDNWPDSTTANPHISDLLVKELPFECFSAELQLVSFIPGAEWQQAGLLLLKDSSANSPSIRISLAYNDYFGGYHRSKEIVTQAIYNSGNSVKPEEFLHSPVLMLDSAAKLPVLFQNLHYVSLRIEKQDGRYHFLFAGGVHPNAPFKELAVKEMAFEPHYIGIFALKGNATKAPVIPVLISGFTLRKLKCD